MSNETGGIPTIYKGVQFRSRLEARWAAFFDLMGWEWHYEPFDLKGWIPDFILHGHDKVVVEVKPIAGMADALFWETAVKIDRSGWDGEVLIVSYFLPRDEEGNSFNELCPGWLGTWFEGCCRTPGSCKHPPCPIETPPMRVWEAAPFQVTDNEKVAAGFCSPTLSFQDRITGYHPGGQFGLSWCHGEEEIEA